MCTFNMLMSMSLELLLCLSSYSKKQGPWTIQPWFTQGISLIHTKEQRTQN